MNWRWIYMLVMLAASTVGLRAQEQVERADTTVIKTHSLSEISAPVFASPRWPSFPIPLPDRQTESEEERVARINLETHLRVMSSVAHHLSFYRPPVLTPMQRALLFAGGLFLTSPYGFRAGTVPVMNASNPFVYAVTPGMAPYEYPYTTDIFPQCIRTEVDFQSGTYKQVMVQWEQVQSSMARNFGNPYRLDPVPRPRYNNSLDYLIP